MLLSVHAGLMFAFPLWFINRCSLAVTVLLRDINTNIYEIPRCWFRFRLTFLSFQAVFYGHIVPVWG